MSKYKERERPLRKEHHTEFDAKLAAHSLSSVPGVLEIQLFGRIARTAKEGGMGKGNDIDLLILVSPEDAEQFRSLVHKRNILGERKDNTPGFRIETAAKVLGRKFATVVKELEQSRPDSRFDVILLEENWRTLLPHMHINDYSEMLRRIERDATRLA